MTSLASRQRPRRKRPTPRVPRLKATSSGLLPLAARRAMVSWTARSWLLHRAAAAREVAAVERRGAQDLGALPCPQRLDELPDLHACGEDVVHGRQAQGGDAQGVDPRPIVRAHVAGPRSLNRSPRSLSQSLYAMSQKAALSGERGASTPAFARTRRSTRPPSSIRPAARSCSDAARSRSSRSSAGGPSLAAARYARPASSLRPAQPSTSPMRVWRRQALRRGRRQCLERQLKQANGPVEGQLLRGLLRCALGVAARRSPRVPAPSKCTATLSGSAPGVASSARAIRR